MKKIILFLLLSLSTLAQTETYTENTDVIANPERGLQKYSKNMSGGNYSLINQSTLINNRTGADKVSILYRYIMLENYLNTDIIDTTYLNNLRTDFNRIRNAGVKVILRLSYTNSYNSVVQPNKNRIISHIEQIATVVNANKDVVFSIQAGSIGVYGEWYYTGGTTSSSTDGSLDFGDKDNISIAQWQNRKEVVDAMLLNFEDVPIQLRYAEAKRQMYGNSIPSDFDQDRIGFYNDAFLNEDGDMGTYGINNCINPVDTSNYNFIASTSRFLPMTGETNGINPCPFPRTLGSNAVLEMNLLNFTTLNRDYKLSVITGVDADDDDNDGNYTETINPNSWVASEHYQEIVKRLGYRFILTSSTLIGNTLTLNVFNDGFASALFEKNVYIVFRQGGTDIKRLTTEDVRYWQKGTNTITLTLPTDLADGTYELLLHIADKNLENRPEYSIQLANNGLWEASTGYNRLNQNFTISSSCAGTSTWNGVSWTGGLPSETRNVVINGNYNTELNGSFDACNLTVNGNLVIPVGTYVTFQEHLEVVGSLRVLNGGTLIPVQTTSTSNGDVSIQRRTTLMKRFDYTYWGSPVATTIGQALGAWQNNYTFEFVTPNFIDKDTVYQNGTPTLVGTPDGQDDDGNAWIVVPQSEIMQQGKGYASMLRSVPATGSYPRTELVTFTGDLTTGVVNYPLQLSGNPSVNNDDFNLVSNPYSALINANDFINLNLSNISGTLAYWTHQGTLSSTYSGLALNNFSTQDYAYYNLSGGIASSFGGKIPTNIMGSCQGFIVEANNTNNITFLPSMMGKAYSNATDVTFFRGKALERLKRAWISLATADKELYSQQLVAYGAGTKTYEAGWDSQIREAKYALKFYSLDERDSENDIQARGEFDLDDEVRLGYISAIEGRLTINLDSIEGIDRAYIKDYGVLKRLPYTFETQAGEFKDRFRLVYKWDRRQFQVTLVPNPTQHTLTVYFDNSREEVVGVFDLQGQQLTVKQTVFLDKVIISTENLKNATYIIRVGGESYKFIKD